MNDLNIFNMTTEFLDNQESNTVSPFYRISLEKEKKDTYSSVIKFLPFYKDWTKSQIWKNVVYLENPDKGEKRAIDCPSTLKEKSILQDIFFALKDSDSIAEQNLSKNFSRSKQHFSLIQIIQDKQHPELEGQIKILQYGVKIAEKISKISHPETDMVEKNNPFDVFKGKSFLMHVKMVSNWQNYDESTFLDKVHGVVIDGVEYKEPNESNMNKILEFLKANSPDLTEYEYAPWTDEIREYVYDSIKSTIPPGKILNQLYKKIPQLKNSSSSVKTVELDVEDDDDYVPEIKPTSKKSFKLKTPSESVLPPDDDIEVDSNSDMIDDEDDEIDEYIKSTSSKPRKRLSMDDDDDF